MKKEIIKISTLISSDVRSRSNAEIIRSAIDGISDKIILDFSGVSFVSRSFTDELCSIVEHCKNITIDMINMSEIVKTMIEAVENIVKNSFDHTQKGDFVRMEWKQSASMVQIRITDNGSGIHPEDLHHIFKRFYRSRFSKDQQGIGLGLPLAKMIVEAHNGTIEVSSEPGTGTTFVLNFLITAIS